MTKDYKNLTLAELNDTQEFLEDKIKQRKKSYGEIDGIRHNITKIKNRRKVLTSQHPDQLIWYRLKDLIYKKIQCPRKKCAQDILVVIDEEIDICSASIDFWCDECEEYFGVDFQGNESRVMFNASNLSKKISLLDKNDTPLSPEKYEELLIKGEDEE